LGIVFVGLVGCLLISAAPGLVPVLVVIWLATKIPAAVWRLLLKVAGGALALLVVAGLLLHLLPLALMVGTLYLMVLATVLAIKWLSIKLIAAIGSLQTTREKMKNDWLYDEKPKYGAW
jgi:hypothetical protein